MTNLKRIELFLENCEVIDIPGNFIGRMDIEDIQHKINRVAVNWISSRDIANYVFLELFAEANQKHNPFGIDDFNSTVFERLMQYNDITQIDVVFDDDIKECYRIRWDSSDNNGEENLNQKYYLSDLGNLYILIAKDKEIKDVVDLEDINDPEDVGIRKSLYGIGSRKDDSENNSSGDFLQKASDDFLEKYGFDIGEIRSRYQEQTIRRQQGGDTE